MDQGREYCSNKLRKCKGIQLQPTITYSPQQNAPTERWLKRWGRCSSIPIHRRGCGWKQRWWLHTCLIGVQRAHWKNTWLLQNAGWKWSQILKSSVPSDAKRLHGRQIRNVRKWTAKVAKEWWLDTGCLWNRAAKKVYIAREVKIDEKCFKFNGKNYVDKNVPLIIPLRYQQEGEQQDVDVANVLESDFSKKECHVS